MMFLVDPPPSEAAPRACVAPQMDVEVSMLVSVNLQGQTAVRERSLVTMEVEKALEAIDGRLAVLSPESRAWTRSTSLIRAVWGSIPGAG
jgi:hypothetical protein